MKKLLLSSVLVIALAALSVSVVSCSYHVEDPPYYVEDPCTEGSINTCKDGKTYECTGGYWSLNCD